MDLVRAFDSQGNICGRAMYTANTKTISMHEAPALTAVRSARTRFRRLVADRVKALAWACFDLAIDNRAYRLVPWGDEAVLEDNLIRAYQAIWRNAEIYQKTFTAVEAQAILLQLKWGLILIDDAAVLGIVAGWPVTRTPGETFARLVNKPTLATYLAEWGLVDSSAHSPYRGLGLGTFLLSHYLWALLSFGQQEVILVTAETGYETAKRNVARPLYEDHGFTPVRDGAGQFITRPVTQRRLDGRLATHRSLFYRGTAGSIHAALQPEKGPVAGFSFETEPC